MKIKGLIFDLDGVITETAQFHFEAWRDELAKFNIHYTEEENLALKGLSRMDTLIAILKSKNINVFEPKKMLEITNNKNLEYVNLLNKKVTPALILPGVNQILAVAKKLNLKMAIASSSFNAPVILEKIGLANLFEFRVDPKNIKNGKPHPDIFLAAVAGLNLKPQECIGFEDAVAGVEGLKKAGIFTVAVTHNSPLDFSIADYLCCELNELNLENLIKKIEQK